MTEKKERYKKINLFYLSSFHSSSSHSFPLSWELLQKVGLAVVKMAQWGNEGRGGLCSSICVCFCICIFISICISIAFVFVFIFIFAILLLWRWHNEAMKGGVVSAAGTAIGYQSPQFGTRDSIIMPTMPTPPPSLLLLGTYPAYYRDILSVAPKFAATCWDKYEMILAGFRPGKVVG